MSFVNKLLIAGLLLVAVYTQNVMECDQAMSCDDNNFPVCCTTDSATGYTWLCCPSNTQCCVGNDGGPACCPIGSTLCPNGSFCKQGTECCNNGCMPQGATCCNGGGFCPAGAVCANC